MEKVLVGMSGGVDSTVAVLMLRRAGYTCVGATLALTADFDPAPAAQAAERLGIDHVVIPAEDAFSACVMEDFISEYRRGNTPNPCVRCNRTVKFPELLAAADKYGCDRIATGHYARIERDRNGGILLKKGLDDARDQSYFLWGLSREILSRTLFPLGELTKDEVRVLASEAGLPNALRRDSQDICFIPDGDYEGFIRSYTGQDYPEGKFLDESGAVLGCHRGIIAYTVGQRRGLGVSAKTPLYVKEKDAKKNTVTLGTEASLYTTELTAGQLSFPGGIPAGAFSCAARIRYRHREEPAVAEPLNDGLVRVVFFRAQRAVTPGQSVVFYNGETVLGGGIIL